MSRSLPMVQALSEGNQSKAAEPSERSPLFKLWAELLSYPKTDYLDKLRFCGAALEENHFEATLLLATFTRAMKKFTHHQLEERYTQTFDVNPIACLDMGWHLYGETYNRGSFLVDMRTLLRYYEVPENTGELPDNMCYALRILGKMDPGPLAAFSREKVLPALAKIVDGFEGKNNPYENLVLALQSFLLHEADVAEQAVNTTHDGQGGFSV